MTAPAQQLRRCADLLLAACTDEQRADLAADPLAAVLSWPGLDVRLTTEVRSPGMCNTDGFYNADSTPPQITIAESMSWRRRNFTALHELGHHLASRNPDVAELLWGPDGHRLEEDICDTFAVRVLFPDDLLEGVFAAPAPTAAQVAELFRKSNASRAACCVAAARLLRSEAYVLTTDLDLRVIYAASVHTEYRLARGAVQPERGLVAHAARVGHARAPAHVRFSSGAESPRLSGDAVRDGDYVFAVITAGIPPWGGPWNVTTDRTPIAPEYDCAHCGHAWEAFVPADDRCDRCHMPHCPSCGRCACEPRTLERRWCPSCGLITAAFSSRSARVCRDCE